MSKIEYEQFARQSHGQNVQSIPHIRDAANLSEALSPEMKIVQILSRSSAKAQRAILTLCSGYLNHLIPVDDALFLLCTEPLVSAGARRIDDSTIALTLFLEALHEARVVSCTRESQDQGDLVTAFRWEFARFEHRAPLSRIVNDRQVSSTARTEIRFEHVAAYLREVTTIAELRDLTTIMSRNLAGTPEERRELYALLLSESFLRVLPTGNEERIDADELRALVNIGFRTAVFNATAKRDLIRRHAA